MFGILIGFEVIISIVLILVILMQSSKGGGLAGTFGGGSVGMVFGVRRTSDFLTRATQILAATFIVLSLLINIFFLPNRTTEAGKSVLQEGTSSRGTMAPQLPPQQAPTTTPTPGNQ